MTKVCKVRKSSRKTKSPFKLNEKVSNDPIILLSEPSSEDNFSETEDNTSETMSSSSTCASDCGFDDIISAYYSDDDAEEEDPNGNRAYLKIKGMLEGYLSDFASDEELEDNDNVRERGYIIEYRDDRNAANADDNTEDSANGDTDTNMNLNLNTVNPNSDEPRSLEDFVEMIEMLSQVLIMKYILKVLNYVRNLQLTTENEKVKKRIAGFFKYIESMPDTEIRRDCDDLRNDLIEFNGGRDLENFPQSGVILIDLIDGNNKGLSPDALSKLSSHKYTGPTQNKCCICMSDIESGDDIIHLKKCTHEYHATCIVSWLKISNQCPICRNVVN